MGVTLGAVSALAKYFLKTVSLTPAPRALPTAPTDVQPVGVATVLFTVLATISSSRSLTFRDAGSATVPAVLLVQVVVAPLATQSGGGVTWKLVLVAEVSDPSVAVSV